MRLLIVNLHLEIGGVETLLVRLIPRLVESGVNVTLLLLSNRINKEFAKALKPYCEIKVISNAFPYSKEKVQKFLGGNFDVAFYTISQSLIVGSWLLNRAGYSNVRVALGVFQTEIFCAPSDGWRLHRKYIHYLLRCAIPSKSIIFGNSAGRDSHAERLGVNFSDSPIIRLFVDVEKYNFKDKLRLSRKKIVSIGRVNDYKTYNFTVMPVIKRLRESGLDVEWHVYGDGEQFDKFKQYIEAYKLELGVFAYGPIPYSQFQAVLDDAFLFVGSGTSLIEAAACGVPSLTTIEYWPEAETYGFISEIEGFNMIEPGLNKKIYKIEDRVRQLISASDEDYLRIQAAERNKAFEYSGTSVVSEYVKSFNQIKMMGSPLRVGIAGLLMYFIPATLGFFVNKIRNMWLVK
jgi:glycosyltransferase involved in cell wall biosynthesis